MGKEDDYISGRGAQIHTDNQFEAQSYGQYEDQGIDEHELGKVKTEFFHDRPKKIVNPVESPDLPMDYSMNPYQGCEHGCTYCYARNSHEYWGFNAGLDFESKIIIKKNAAEVLDKQLRSPKWIPKPVMLSGNTDCYQPIERKMEITREILKVFLKYRHPVGIITKNDLVLRDLDILEQLNEFNLVHVNLSITTLNEDLRRILEPRTSSVANRLKAVQKLSEANIPVNVMMAPVIPALNSQEMPNLMKSLSEAGALSTSYTILRLNGKIGDIFTDWLEKNLPDRAEKVRRNRGAIANFGEHIRPVAVAESRLVDAAQLADDTAG